MTLKQCCHLRDACADTARAEPCRELRRVRLGQPCPVDDLEQHLDLERWLCDQRRRGLQSGVSLDLGVGPRALPGKVEILVVNQLATKLLALDQIEQRIVHAHPEPQRQLALGAPGLGSLDDPLHRRLQRSIAGKADALVAPEPVGVELEHRTQRVVAAVVGVAREVVEVREPTEHAHARCRPESAAQLGELGNRVICEKAFEGAA